MKSLLFIISNFLKKRTALEKLFLVIILVVGVYATVVSVQKAIYKYRYFKQVERDYERASDSINALNLQIKDLTQKQQTKTKKVQKKSKAINNKLKEDETIIDNTPVDDDALNDYISKHENG